ncbi:MAG: hypothetical protein JO030_01190, partial [Candidatus Eremiobacteraeota bacterium]|nr:hypothetical protein [Candidatus Eremiobacteraeota bacterium]
ERLQGEGARVRVCSDSEKIAVCGDEAWIGSANATAAFGESDIPDWGVRTADGAIVAAAKARLESQWSAARELRV